MGLESIIKIKLFKGMEIKNYKELCIILGTDIKKGKSRELHLKDFERYFLWDKLGHKFIIKEIFNIPKKKIDFRGNNNTKIFHNLLIEKQHEHRQGVYKITLDNSIYIGSTKSSFRRRFCGHRSKENTLETREMLDNGAIFEVIEFCDGLSEFEIRTKEGEYIDYYINETDYNVVNSRSVYRSKKKSKMKYIKVKNKDYEKAIKILEEKSIMIL